MIAGFTDDMANGPVAFLRSLEVYTWTSDITAEHIGQTWLNYAPNGHGFSGVVDTGNRLNTRAYLNLEIA